MFELRPDIPDEEVVVRARSAKCADCGWFTIVGTIYTFRLREAS
jgi:hypothetical protein